ncbi:hypothetical protein U1Q18_026859 [Sarracenia purpurea var. burkii]
MRGLCVSAMSVSSSIVGLGSIITVRRRLCYPMVTVRYRTLRFENGTSKYWDEFYKRHQNKFFKDRHYLEKDWGKYFHDDNSASRNGKVVLESHVDFNEDQVNAFVCDAVNDDLCDRIMPSSIDVVTLVTSAFYFSEESLSTLFTNAGFSVVDMDIYSRRIQNRSRNITMCR